MKTLTIFFSDADPIVIDDHDDKAIEEYTNELSKLLESNNITLLHTTSCSIIIRPNAISAVIVSNTPETPKEPIRQNPSEKKKEIKKESDTPQDIISD